MVRFQLKSATCIAFTYQAMQLNSLYKNIQKPLDGIISGMGSRRDLKKDNFIIQEEVRSFKEKMEK